MQENPSPLLLAAYGKRKQLFLLLAAVLLGTLPFWFFPLDFWGQNFFYCADQSGPALWCYADAPLWDFLYHYGVWPAAGVAVAAVLVLLLSQMREKFSFFKKKRIYAVFLILTIVLGPGLLINSFLKMQCGRPRPRETTHYQGTWQYKHVAQKGITGKGKSFPCGHCSMGFIFMSFYFILYRKRKALAYFFLFFGLFWGGLIGMARMSQGGHFLSDVLWSGIVVFFSAWLTYHYILKIPQREIGLLQAKDNSPRKARTTFLVSLSLVVAIVAGILLATPVFKEYVFTSAELKAGENNELALSCERCYIRLTLDNTQQIHLHQTAQGFGFPGAKVYHWLYMSFARDTNEYFFHFTSRGFFSELVNTIEISLPAQNLTSLSLEVKQGDVLLQNSSAQKPAFPVEVKLAKDGVLQADSSFQNLQKAIVDK